MNSNTDLSLYGKAQVLSVLNTFFQKKISTSVSSILLILYCVRSLTEHLYVVFCSGEKSPCLLGQVRLLDVAIKENRRILTLLLRVEVLYLLQSLSRQLLL